LKGTSDVHLQRMSILRARPHRHREPLTSSMWSLTSLSPARNTAIR